jgi:lysozyme
MRGIDISTWQHPGGAAIDFFQVAEAGFGFVIVKATQGDWYVNPWLERDLDDARAAGLLVGAYHFYDLGVAPEAQAKHFVGVLLGQHLDLGAWLDWEPPAMEPWQVTGLLTAWDQAVNDGRPSCGLYCDISWWEVIKAAQLPPRRLWIAAPSEPAAPAGATIWQRGQGSVPGVPAPVDIDELVSTRSLNPPSAPKPRPSPETVHPPRLPPEPDEAPTAESCPNRADADEVADAGPDKADEGPETS